MFYFKKYHQGSYVSEKIASLNICKMPIFSSYTFYHFFFIYTIGIQLFQYKGLQEIIIPNDHHYHKKYFYFMFVQHFFSSFLLLLIAEGLHFFILLVKRLDLSFFPGKNFFWRFFLLLILIPNIMIINIKMRLCWYLLGAMLALESESTKSYGSSSASYPTEAIVDEFNHICNGDFEDPPVPDGKEWHHFKNIDIPCWAGTKDQIELGEANFYVHEMTSQVLELTADKETLNQGFQQMVNLEKGTYTLKFDYAAR
jgi:hypothetical protein